MVAAWRGEGGAHLLRWRRRALIGAAVFVGIATLLLTGALLLVSAVVGTGTATRAIAVLAGTILVVAIGLRLARRALRPFDTAVTATEAARRALLADLAHEIRTPLTVLQANIEGVLDGVYEADEERLRLLLGEVDVLQRLLADLSTLSTAESGRLELDLAPIDPVLLARAAVAAQHAAATAADITLAVVAPPDHPQAGGPAVEADEVRLRQVLGALIANAIRHTPAGGTIEVEVRTAGDGASFEVRDTGEGFDPALLDVAFERFVRADRGGTGLGLAVARSLVEAHGGRIVASNAPGGGAVVRFNVTGRRPTSG